MVAREGAATSAHEEDAASTRPLSVPSYAPTPGTSTEHVVDNTDMGVQAQAQVSADETGLRTTAVDES
ncbi:MAG: hypothetical protein EOO41_01405 [Methanobacteriota archaeon]|nr:MAG: hypothetical protein EOO41_01405 [Euryarchaeota archaeon]